MTTRINTKTARKRGEMTQNAKGKYGGFKDPNVVYIGRGWGLGSYSLKQSDWHNPYQTSEYEREEAVRLYREYLLEKRPDLLARLGELEGKTLACWCESDAACHADVLIELIEGVADKADV